MMAEENKGAEVVTLKPRGSTGSSETVLDTDAMLADAGVDYSVAVPWQDMKLPEPQYGETIVRVLSGKEGSIFYELWRVRMAMEDLERTVVGNALKQVGEVIAESDRNKPMWELVQDGKISPDFENDEQAESYFRFMKRQSLLHSIFHWMIGESQSAHRSMFGVRKPETGKNDLRLVRVRDRYEPKGDQ